MWLIKKEDGWHLTRCKYIKTPAFDAWCSKTICNFCMNNAFKVSSYQDGLLPVIRKEISGKLMLFYQEQEI